MPWFILQSNIAHYKERLTQETDPKTIAVVHKLLAEEEDKLAAYKAKNLKAPGLAANHELRAEEYSADHELAGLLAPSNHPVIPRVTNRNRQMMLASHDPSIINDRLFMSLVIIAGALIVALAASKLRFSAGSETALAC